MAGMIDLTAAARMYLNPDNPNQIWINIGFIQRNAQRYPAYEPFLAPYVSQDQFNQLMAVLCKEFEDPPFDGAGGPMCAYICCMSTFCICFCPLLYVWRKAKLFNERVLNAIENNGKHIGVNATFLVSEIAMPNYDPARGNWVDSKGQPLLIRQGNKRRGYGYVPGGPPLGANLILNLPAPVSWPPTMMTVNTMQPPGAITTVQPGRGAGPFCSSCGTEIGEANFCASCGAPAMPPPAYGY